MDPFHSSLFAPREGRKNQCGGQRGVGVQGRHRRPPIPAIVAAIHENFQEAQMQHELVPGLGPAERGRLENSRIVSSESGRL